MTVRRNSYGDGVDVTYFLKEISPLRSSKSKSLRLKHTYGEGGDHKRFVRFSISGERKRKNYYVL